MCEAANLQGQGSPLGLAPTL